MTEFPVTIKFNTDKQSLRKAEKDAQKTGKSSKSGGGKAAFAGGFLGSLLGELVSSVKALFDPISAIATLLVASLFPLFKPFLILFLKVGIMLFNWLNSILGTDSPVKGITGKDPESGKTIVGEAGKKIALWAGIIGGALAAITAAIIGFPGLLVVAIGIGIALLVKPLVEFGMWLSAKFYEFGQYVRSKLDEWWTGMMESFSSLYNNVSSFFSEWWGKIYSAFQTLYVKLSVFFVQIWDKIKAAFESLYNKLKDMGSWAWDKLTSVLSTSFEALKGIGQWISDKIKDIWNGIKSVGSSLVSGAKNLIGMNDGIITPKGDVIRTNPNDYIIATKNPGSLMGGGGSSGANITINVQGVMDDRLIDEMSRKLQRVLNYGGNF
jgi:hypothetical protein